MKKITLVLLVLALLVAPALYHTERVRAEDLAVITPAQPAAELHGIKKFFQNFKEKFQKVNSKKLQASQISAAATRAVLASPERDTEVPKYIGQMNHELLQNGVNYNSKSFFATKTFKASAEAKIFDILAERKKVLLQLIQDGKADQVGAYALPLLTRNLLPAGSQSLYEEKKTLTGDLAQSYSENFSGEPTSTLKNELVVGGTRYQFYPTQPVSASSGARITANGLLLEDNFIGDVSSHDTSALKVTPVSHKVAVILAKYTDAAPDPFTPAVANTKVFSGQFKNFYTEQSYGKIAFSGTVFGWYTIPRASPNCDYPSLDNDIAPLIQQNNINLSTYQHVVVLTNCVNAGFAKGSSDVGVQSHVVNGQNYNFSFTTLNASGPMFLSNSLNSANNVPTFSWTNLDFMLSHEIGHSLGLQHANGYDCGSVTLDTVSFGKSSACTSVIAPPGNPFDVMGDGRGYAFHFNAFYKELLGWIDATNSVTVTTTGSYTITPFESGTGTKTVKIQLQNSTLTPYYIEWRKASGFDGKLSVSTLSSNATGLIINRAYSDGMPPYNGARMLDMRPTSAAWTDDIKTTSLNGTSTFVDARNGITIGPITVSTSTTKTFTVTYSPIACVRKNPIIIDASGFILHPGDVFGIFPSVYNDDYTGCAPSNVSLAMTLPSGFSANSLSNTYSNLAAEQSHSITLPAVTVSASAAPGTYNMTLTATNLASNMTSTTVIPFTVQ